MARLLLTPRQEADYAAIVALMRIGGDLTPYYRRSDTADRLLKARQVLHLHLGGPGSDAILYAVQYPNHVLLVRIDTHTHLDDIPPGKNLPTLGRRKFETELEREAKAQKAELAEALKRLLKPPRRPKS